jgi:hypothetical protein
MLVEDRWLCAECQHHLDKERIEQQLVEITHSRVVAYQLQDMVCVKCHQVSDHVEASEFDADSECARFARTISGTFARARGPFNPTLFLRRVNKSLCA